MKTIFTSKLGWNLMIKIDILYDRIIRAKYKYANLSILDIHFGIKDSHILGYNKSLTFGEKNDASWIIHNKHSIRFWHDDYISGFDKLYDMINCVASYYHKYTFRDYASLKDLIRI